MAQTPLYVGACQIVVTPPIGTAMAGYLQRDGPSEGIIDDLCMQALVLHKGAEWLVLLCVDTLYVDSAFGAVVAQNLRLPRERVIVTASHTHSGPQLVRGLDVLDPSDSAGDGALRDMWISHAVGAVRWAMQSLAPVSVTCGSTLVGDVGGDRNDPAQPVDRDLVVLSFSDRASEKPRAVLLNYACHPTVLGAQNRHFSTDFVGPLRLAMGGRATSYAGSPESPVVMFVNGAAGNVSTRFHRCEQSVVEARRLGTLVAKAAQSAVMRLLDAQSDWQLLAARHEIALKRRSMPDEPEARLALKDAEGEYQQGLAAKCDAGSLRILRTRYEGALRQAELSAASRLAGGGNLCSAGVSQWAIGPVRLAAVPAELFSSLGCRIKQGFPRSETLVAGYSDGMVGYIPDLDGYQSSSYEALSTSLRPGEGEALCDRIVEGLRGL